MKRIAECLGFGFGTCLKFYLFSALPSVWLWMPLIAIERYYRKEIVK